MRPGTLPAHQINQVQAYGFLVVTDLQLKIVQVSENISDHTALSATQAIGKPFNDLLPETDREIFHNAILNGISARKSLRLTGFGGRAEKFLMVMNAVHGCYLFEIENDRSSAQLLADNFQKVREVSDAIMAADTIHTVLEVACASVRKISRFDRVMVSRFDAEWNNEILASGAADDWESFSGMTFPAGDFPRSERELYRRNPYRHVPDYSGPMSRLYPVINPVLSSFTDLGSCNLRGITKNQADLMKGMGVRSSIIMGITLNNVLWGQLICHHRDKEIRTSDECLVFELIASMLSARLSSIMLKREAERTISSQTQQARLLAEIFAGSNLRQGIMKAAPGMLSFFDATGLSLVYGNAHHKFGTVPPESFVEELVNWLEAKEVRAAYMTSYLQEDFEPAIEMTATCSGIIVFPLAAQQREFLILYRREEPREITWAGEPAGASGLPGPTTRNFNPYKQTVRGYSLPFTEHAAAQIKNFHNIIQHHRLNETRKITIT